jgi:hypothetical protein
VSIQSNNAWVHVCYCANGGENIAELIQDRPKQRLLRFYDALNQGPLKDVHIPSGIQAREAYWNNICSINPEFSSRGLGYTTTELGTGVLLPAPTANESAMIWLGQTSNEQMMLRAVCAYWPKTDLWVADVRQLKPWFPATFPSVPCFTPQALAQLESMAERLKVEHQRELADEWHELIRQDHLLRIYQDGKIRGVAEDFFDAFLLNACTSEWQFQARVAGNCQANSGYSSVGDVFLFYRLELMAQRGLVEFQRNQYGDFRHDKVRKL